MFRAMTFMSQYCYYLLVTAKAGDPVFLKHYKILYLCNFVELIDRTTLSTFQSNCHNFVMKMYSLKITTAAVS